MEYKEFKPTQPKSTKIKKVLIIAGASIVLVGLIGYGTVAVLRQVNAPTLSNESAQTPPPNQTPPVNADQAQQIADDAYAAAFKKVESGDQKAALADYKTAYENYKLAENTARADDAQFAIKSIEAVLAASANPTKPSSPKAAAKE